MSESKRRGLFFLGPFRDSSTWPRIVCSAPLLFPLTCQRDFTPLSEIGPRIHPPRLNVAIKKNHEPAEGRPEHSERHCLFGPRVIQQRITSRSLSPRKEDGRNFHSLILVCGRGKGCDGVRRFQGRRRGKVQPHSLLTPGVRPRCRLETTFKKQSR